MGFSPNKPITIFKFFVVAAGLLSILKIINFPRRRAMVEI